LTISEERISKVGNRVSSIVPSLIRFYTFLQSWGVSQKYQNEQDFIYDYQSALDQEKDLDREVDQFQETLENLRDFLFEAVDLSLYRKQKLIFDARIIELLIITAQLIDTKIYGTRN